MEIRLELFSRNNSLLGIDYKAGKAFHTKKQKEVDFHEVGIGLVFLTLYMTFY